MSGPYVIDLVTVRTNDSTERFVFRCENGCFALSDRDEMRDVENKLKQVVAVITGEPEPAVGGEVTREDCYENRFKVEVGQVYEFLPPKNPFTERPYKLMTVIAVRDGHYVGTLSPSKGAKESNGIYELCMMNALGSRKLKTP